MRLRSEYSESSQSLAVTIFLNATDVEIFILRHSSSRKIEFYENDGRIQNLLNRETLAKGFGNLF